MNEKMNDNDAIFGQVCDVTTCFLWVA